MNNDVIELNNQGLMLLKKGRFNEAVQCFTRAIELDPNFAEAYKNRGDAYFLLDRYVDGNTDKHRYKEISSGRSTRRRAKETRTKMDLHEMDSIYDTLLGESDSENYDDSTNQYDENLFDYMFAEDIADTGDYTAEAEQYSAGEYACPAILEFVGGNRLEAAGAIMFKPSRNELTIIDDQSGTERVLPLDIFTCIRTAEIPPALAHKKDRTGCEEIIETIDGAVHNELIHTSQDLDNLLFGFSTEEQTPFTFSFIPRNNITKRLQKRPVGEILVDKRYIAKNILNKALEEFHTVKRLKIGKIIARKARILQSTIEDEIEKAGQNKITGLRIGEILLSSGLVNEQQILEALEYQEKLRNLKIGQFLVQKGIVNERDVYISLAEKHRIPFIDLSKQKLSRSTLQMLPQNLVLRNEIIPVALKDDTLVVATHNVETAELCEQLLQATKCSRIKFALTQPTHIQNIITQFYRDAA